MEYGHLTTSFGWSIFLNIPRQDLAYFNFARLEGEREEIGGDGQSRGLWSLC